MPEAKDTNDPCPARIVSPNETEYLTWLAGKLRIYPDFWEDRMRINPGVTFAWLFANSNSVVFDLDGGGVLSFVVDPLKYRAFLYGASWEKKAMRIPITRRMCATAAMASKDLLSIEGITKYNNKVARKAMEASGMTYRGRILNSLWYNRVPVDGALYEFRRDQTDLDPLV